MNKHDNLMTEIEDEHPSELIKKIITQCIFEELSIFSASDKFKIGEIKIGPYIDRNYNTSAEAILFKLFKYAHMTGWAVNIDPRHRILYGSIAICIKYVGNDIFLARAIFNPDYPIVLNGLRITDLYSEQIELTNPNFSRNFVNNLIVKIKDHINCTPTPLKIGNL